MKNKEEKILTFLFILPSVILIAVFVYGFIGWTGWISLTNWKDVVPDLPLWIQKLYRPLSQPSFSDRP